MSDLFPIALEFCRECLGWSQAFSNGAVIREKPWQMGTYEPGELDWLDLTSVVEAVSKWADTFSLAGGFTGVYVALVGKGGLTGQLSKATSTDPCHALLTACVEAARKLKAGA